MDQSSAFHAEPMLAPLSHKAPHYRSILEPLELGIELYWLPLYPLQVEEDLEGLQTEHYALEGNRSAHLSQSDHAMMAFFKGDVWDCQATGGRRAA